jgi:hypothetical protein
MEKITVHRIDLLNLTQGEVAGINHVIETAKYATVFHTLEWNRLLIGYFNLPHVALLACRGESIVGLHLLFQHDNFTYRSPAIHLQSVYGGPLALDDDPAILRALIEGSERSCRLAYFKVWTSPNMDPLPFTQCQYAVEPMQTPVMNLGIPEEAQWDKLHRDKRNKIRKAQKAGLEFHETGLESLEEYYSIATETLTRGGVKPLPLAFLRAALERLKPMGMARLFIVRQTHQIISGTIILYFHDTAYGWDLGWRRDYSVISPNDFMIWEVARRASRDGLKWLDLLRIEPDRLPGIARWKATFGCEIVPCHLLRKETFILRLVKPVKIAFTQPQRVIRKFRTLVR